MSLGATAPAARPPQPSVGTIEAVSECLVSYGRNVDLLRSLLQGDGGAEQLSVQESVLDALRAKARGALDALRSGRGGGGGAPRERARLLKLTKDFQKINEQHNQLSVEVRRAAAGAGGKFATAAAAAAPAPQRSVSLNGRSAGPVVLSQVSMSAQSESVDDFIIREYAKDIKKINQDLHQLNELSRDMAQITASQTETIMDIGETMEAARTHAENGLEQVKKANEQQQGCAIA